MTDREKLIELLRETEINKINGHVVEAGVSFTPKVFEAFADHLLANGVTVQQWTPASQPPEVWRDKNGTLVNYLVYMPEYGVDFGNYMEPAKFWLCRGIPCKVTHWMPLPKPPKEDKHE